LVEVEESRDEVDLVGVWRVKARRGFVEEILAMRQLAVQQHHCTRRVIFGVWRLGAARESAGPRRAGTGGMIAGGKRRFKKKK
jgi:hypothetical protein